MKWHYLAPVLLMAASCSPSPDELLAKAKTAFAAHDYAAARLHLAAAAEKAPGQREIVLLQAKTALALGDGDGAAAALARLTGGKAPAGELAELMAEAALLRQAPVEARQLVGTATSAEASRLRALAFLQEQNGDGAKEQFQQAVAAGGNTRAYADYARFLIMEGDIDGARDMSNRALKAAPAGLDALLVGGQMAAMQGDPGLALKRYSAAADRYPASVAARIGQAAVLGDLGRLDDMDRKLTALAQSGVKTPELTYLQVKSAAVRKDWAKVRNLVQAVEWDLPLYDPSRLLYGEALLRLDQHAQAIAQIEPVARAQPGNRVAQKLLAEAQLAEGDAGGAFTTLRPIADSAGAEPEELQLMAKIAAATGDASADSYRVRAVDLAEANSTMRKGNWAGAVTAYDRMLASTDGKNAMMLNNMAYAQLMLGNGTKALTFARRALALEPDNPSVLDTMGWTLFKVEKNPSEARRFLSKAAKLAPGNRTIEGHLTEVERVLKTQG